MDVNKWKCPMCGSTELNLTESVAYEVYPRSDGTYEVQRAHAYPDEFDDEYKLKCEGCGYELDRDEWYFETSSEDIIIIGNECDDESEVEDECSVSE